MVIASTCLIIACSGCVGTASAEDGKGDKTAGGCVLDQTNEDRTDPNPKKPKVPAPPQSTKSNSKQCSYRVEVVWKDIPSGVNWEGWVGIGRHIIDGDPRFGGIQPIHLGIQPDGIQLNGLVKATAPELGIPKSFKPLIQLTIYGLNVKSGKEFKLSGPTKTKDRNRPLTISTNARCKK